MKQRLLLLTFLPVLLIAWLVWLLKYLWAILFDPSHAWRLAVSKDQLANTALNGSEDETISSRAGRHNQGDEHQELWAKWLCKALDVFDPNHCNKSIGV